MVRRLQAAVVGGNPAATIMQREGVNDHKSNKENYDFFCDNISKMWAEGQKYISYKPHVFNDITADRYEHFKCGNIECKFEVYDEKIGFDNNVDIYFSCFFTNISQPFGSSE